MQGYFVTFFTQQSREHNGMPVASWIVEEARRLGVRGATLFSGSEGFGHDGRFHSDNFFDLEDPPVQVALALSKDECDNLMARFTETGLRVFFTKSEIEFGFTSDS
jgi:PII-like signaling protein